MEKFVNAIVKLDNIKQWEERDAEVKESVSQHSFKSGAIAVYLSKVLCKDADKDMHSFFNDCIIYALLHDFDEAILGRDIGHMVKYNEYNGDKIRSVLNDYVNMEMKTNYSAIMDSMKPTYDVKLFCKMIDWFCQLIFIERNAKMGCNSFQYERDYCISNVRQKIAEVVSMFKNKFDKDIENELNTIFNPWIKK